MTTPSEPGPDADAPRPLTPKEQMAAALEAKKAAHHASAESASGIPGKAGGSQNKGGSKRMFRRKAGG